MTQVELAAFVESLRIPADRKVVVLAELSDHLACALREGRDPAEALGDLEALRRSLEAIEPAFRVSRGRALARGAIASLLIAVALDQGGPLMGGVVGAIVALALAALLAPPRALELLRAELRAPKMRGLVFPGIPIGPAATYALTVLVGPYLIWIALIVQRGYAGAHQVDSTWAAFALSTAVWTLFLVEAVRARRHATT
jgi:hypothetical protein